MKHLKNICLILLLAIVIVSCQNKFEFLEAPVIEKNPNKSVQLATVLKFNANQQITLKTNFFTEGHSFSTEFKDVDDAKDGLPVIGMKAGKTYTINLEIITGEETFT